MKRQALVLSGLMFIALLIALSCKKKDTVPPTITLHGSDSMSVILKGTFTDPGASATDDVDGAIDVSVSGSVNVYSSGWYTLTYTATDLTGNEASATRSVVVDAASYLAGIYDAIDLCQGVTSAPYLDTVTATLNTYNRIQLKWFASFMNGSVYGTIAGSTITIPQQTVNCGIPDTTRTFSGFGSYTDSTMEIHYTRVTNGHVVTGSVDTYTRHH